MAGSGWKSAFTPTVERTIERVAIAALAAIATRAEGSSVAIAAITIFCIVAVVEELGRGWMERGKRVTLRDLAWIHFRDRSVRSSDGRADPGQSKRRARARHRTRSKDPDQADQVRRKVQK